jgi:hypothetical protein
VGNFAILLIPQPPVLQTPAGTVPSYTTSVMPVYPWSAVLNAVAYELRVHSGQNRFSHTATAAEAGCPGGTGTCSVTVPAGGWGSLEEGTVRWQVRGINEAGIKGGTATGSFIVDIPREAATAPVNLSPADGTTVTTVGSFSWDAVANTQQYRLRINNGSSLRFDQTYWVWEIASCNTGTCSVTPTLTGLAPGDVIWVVEADGQRSATQTFSYTP